MPKINNQQTWWMIPIKKHKGITRMTEVVIKPNRSCSCNWWWGGWLNCEWVITCIQTEWVWAEFITYDNSVSWLTAVNVQEAIDALVSSGWIGDVLWPSSSVNGNIAIFSWTSGKVIADSWKSLPTWDIVWTTDTQVITNKTIDWWYNTLQNIPQSAITDLVTDLAGKSNVGHTHIVANITDLTATASELNVLDWVTATTAEINYIDWVTSPIQTQLDAKANTSITVTWWTWLTGWWDLSANRTISLDSASIASLWKADTALQSWDNVSDLTNDAWYTNNTGTVTSVATGTWLTGWTITSSGTIALDSASIASLALADSAIQNLADLWITATASELNILDWVTATTAELNYVAWVTSSIQTQLDGKAADSAVVKLTGDQTVAWIKTFSSFPVTPSSAPTTDYQTANKKYVDDSLNSYNSATATLTNKRINPRIYSTTSTGTLSYDRATYDSWILTAQTASLTIANPANVNIGESWSWIIYTASAQTLSFGTNYVGVSGLALPTTTTAGKYMELIFTKVASNKVLSTYVIEA